MRSQGEYGYKTTDGLENRTDSPRRIDIQQNLLYAIDYYFIKRLNQEKLRRVEGEKD